MSFCLTEHRIALTPCCMSQNHWSTWTWSRKPFSDWFITKRVVSLPTTALHLYSQVESLISRLTSKNVIAWFIFSILQESKANTNLLQRRLLERLERALTRKKMAVFVLCSIAYDNLCLWFREDLATGIMTLVCLKHRRRYRDILTAPQNLLGRRSGWMNGSKKCDFHDGGRCSYPVPYWRSTSVALKHDHNLSLTITKSSFCT